MVGPGDAPAKAARGLLRPGRHPALPFGGTEFKPKML